MITEATAGEEIIKGWCIRGNRNGAMIRVRGHPHLGVRGGERIFKKVREKPERLEQNEALLHFESQRELFHMKRVGNSIK